MNTPTGRSAANLPPQQGSKAQAQAHGAAGKGEQSTAKKTTGPKDPAEALPPQKANMQVPRGPFKIMTIPQAWYNSLHAAPPPVEVAGTERD